MKLFFLSKRSPQQRDLFLRPYGRFFHLPRLLAAAGHEVHLCLLGHRGEVAVDMWRDGMHWSSHDLGGGSAPRAFLRLAATVRDLRPDWVLGVSDAWVSVIAGWLAKRSGARLALDAYDDYESYMPWNLPLHACYRRSIRQADLVTAAGPQLAQHLALRRKRGEVVQVLRMAADPQFVPRDRAQCRALLGLPPSTPLIGYYGSWGKARGTELLIPAFRRVRDTCPEALLVLTGRPPEEVRSEPGVQLAGYLDDDQLPAFVSAINVSAIVTADTRFGRASYPAKLCEAMACAVPVVATETAPVRWMLGDAEDSLVPVGDAGAFADRLVAALACGRSDYGPQATWTSQAQQLAHWLKAS